MTTVGLPMVRLLGYAFLKPFPSLSHSDADVLVSERTSIARFDKRPRRTLTRSPQAVPREITLPWTALMISQNAAAVLHDDRGRGSACAKAVDATTSRGVGISVTARTPNACAWSDAGWRRVGRPDCVRTMRPKSRTPRSNVRAGVACHLRRKHRRSPRLRRRVVTQQKFCCRRCRRPCVTGQGAMNRP